ncbi:MAG: domain S-box protein, partial [Acidobacteriota bacterium]|nr:domain S-box protein [Acidobacteriota bacterium]
MPEKTELKKKVFEVAKHLYPCDLPIGVYLVTQDGEFVRCNPRAREILQLPQSGDDIHANINDFYYDPGERSRIMKKLEDAEANGKCLE